MPRTLSCISESGKLSPATQRLVQRAASKHCRWYFILKATHTELLYQPLSINLHRIWSTTFKALFLLQKSKSGSWASSSKHSIAPARSKRLSSIQKHSFILHESSRVPSHHHKCSAYFQKLTVAKTAVKTALAACCSIVIVNCPIVTDRCLRHCKIGVSSNNQSPERTKGV